MELIKKTIGIKNITGNTLGITLMLTSEFNNSGYLTDLSNNSTLITTGDTVTITGFTENKLNIVKSYDINNNYITGINGVTNINDNLISYTINNINYTTDLSSTGLTTTFSTSYQDINYGKNSFVLEEKYMSLVDKVNIDNTVNIQRQSLSIMSNFSKLRSITSVNEIVGFNNGFYQVFDQTI